MKKIAIVLLAVLFTGILMSSCKSTAPCAAYGETNKYQIETRY